MARKNIQFQRAGNGQTYDARREALAAMSWNDLQRLAGSLEVLRLGMKRHEIEAAILAEEAG